MWSPVIVPGFFVSRLSGRLEVYMSEGGFPPDGAGEAVFSGLFSECADPPFFLAPWGIVL